MMSKKPSIYWLNEFGLDLDQLTSLGSLKVKLHVYLRHVNERSLFKFTPRQRVEKTKRHYELLFSRVKKKWQYGPIKTFWIRGQPRGFSTSMEASRIEYLLRIPEIHSIWLDEIPGRKRKKAKPKERWFAVQARFAIQVEGQKTGMQSFEDRILIVKAISFKNAEKKLLSEFKEYGTPYLNPYGFMARWAFESILDVYEIGDEEIDPRGVEVFSVMRQRRMKPDYAWKMKSK